MQSGFLLANDALHLEALRPLTQPLEQVLLPSCAECSKALSLFPKRSIYLVDRGSLSHLAFTPALSDKDLLLDDLSLLLSQVLGMWIHQVHS